MNKTEQKNLRSKAICSGCNIEIENTTPAQITFSRLYGEGFECDKCTLYREIDEIIIMIQNIKTDIKSDKQKAKTIHNSIQKNRQQRKLLREKWVSHLILLKSKKSLGE